MNRLPGMNAAVGRAHGAPMIAKGLALALAAACMGFSIASAQEPAFPDKAVRFVLPYGPGAGGDLSTRQIGAYLQAKWKQPVLVENRPGGGNIIGLQYALSFPPDGHAIAMVSQTLALTPFVQKTPYAWTDFSLVTRNIVYNYVLAVNPAVSVNSLKEFVAYARSKPGGLNYAYVGHTNRLSGLQLADLLGAPKFTEVPFTSGPSMANALLGGQVDFYFAVLSDMSILSGKARILATAASAKLPQYPDLPTMSEVAPGYSLYGWTGFGVKTGTPRPVIAKLQRDIVEALRTPESEAFHKKAGLALLYETPEEATAHVQREYESYAKYAKIAGLKPE